MIKFSNNSSQIEQWCNLCLDNIIYIPRWQLYFYYKHPHCIKGMTVFIDGDLVVAAACYIPSACYTLQIFVKPSYRKKGIGKQIIENLLEQVDTTMTVDVSDYRIKFWRTIQSDKILFKGKE